MKSKRILLAVGLCVSLGAGVLSARTWTSAEGAKTFEGEFKSFDTESAKVTVIVKNGRTMTFGLDKLSEEDRNWIKKQPSIQDLAAEAEAREEFEKSKLGKAVKDLKILDGDEFKEHKLAPPPKYYILYFSGSWCGPCVQLAPRMVKTYNDKIGTNPAVEMIHLSRDDDKGDALNWAKKEKFPWPTIMQDDTSSFFSKHFGGAVPTFVLIDCDGKVLANDERTIFENLGNLDSLGDDK